MLRWTPILYDISQALESVADPELRIDRVFELLGTYVPYDRGVLLEASPVLARTITIIPAPESIDDTERLTRRAEALLAMLIERSPDAHRTADIQITRAGRPHLAVPIFSLGEVIAVLLVERADRSYDEKHVGFLSVVASKVGAYLGALKSHREVRMLTDSSPDILSRFDRNLRHIFVNAAIESATGLKRGAIIGRTIAEIGIPKELGELWTQHLCSVFDTGTPTSLQFSFKGPNGLRHYAARLVPERNATGDVHGVLAVTTDCTTQRETEDALRDADRQKDMFLATLAHELRNPLAPMRNAAKIIATQGAEASQLQWASEVIERQIQHMSRLLDDLFDINRITRNTLDLHKTRADLAGIVAAAVETIRPVIEVRAHQLIVSAPATSILVNADPTRLAQVFSNLLNNAAKYTAPQGQIRVTITREDGTAQVSVADNGEGIPAALLTKVFEPFVQITGQGHAFRDGLGIGLTLAERLVKLHGGKIEARSDGPGHGSEFVVRLPLAGEDAAMEQERERTPGAAVDSQRILIADDNHDSADTLALIFQAAGNTTRTVYDGRTAVEVAETFRPQIILLDLAMPGLSGTDVCRYIREQPWGTSVRIVAVSGLGQKQDHRRTLAAGFNQHLTKPVNPDQLLALLSASEQADQAKA
jgi:PAS domain S-box-containing protein